VFEAGETCLILEDVITSGISIQETSSNLRRAGFVVGQAVVFLDREQGGRQRLASLENGEAIQVHAVVALLSSGPVLLWPLSPSIPQFLSPMLTGDTLEDHAKANVGSIESARPH